MRSFWIFLLLSGLAGGTAKGAELFHVAPDGRDDWSGRPEAADPAGSDGPFATLEKARDTIRALRSRGELAPGPVRVRIRGGIYLREQAFELTAEDGGTPEEPVIYEAWENERPRLVGGRPVTNFTPLPPDLAADRIDPGVRDRLVVADLRALGISDFGQLSRRGFSLTVPAAGLELFFQDRPMTLARWPDEGFVHIAEVTGGEPFDAGKWQGDRIGTFTWSDDRHARWINEPEIWLHGYWFWDWADSYERVESLDPATRTIVLARPFHHYGYRKNARYYAVNVLAELDRPGEWYLDRPTGRLYFWPPAPLSDSTAYVSTATTLLSLQGVSHVRVIGLTLEVCRGTAVRLRDCTDTVIGGCLIRNAGLCGLELKGGLRNRIIGCDITGVGDDGMSIEGGDRATLTPAGHEAINNHIHHYARWSRTYRSGIMVAGVGNRLAHNLIHHAPHTAIGLMGNDHLIEFNEIHHVCTETDDAGAFYMGRDWTQRGNVIRWNYWHDIGDYQSWIGSQAVYLDDWSSGTTVFGNVFRKVFRAVMIGGGRDNIIRNNLFTDCRLAIHLDARGVGWARSYFDGRNNTLIERLQAVPYRQPPWSTRYPELLTLYEDEPALPKGNVIENNIAVGGRWLDLSRDPGLNYDLIRIAGNMVLQDAGAAEMDPRAIGACTRPADAPGPGGPTTGPAGTPCLFERIPTERIGLYQDALRATWPVPSP